jgi:GNAT superfamily N-acetyltransferase
MRFREHFPRPEFTCVNCRARVYRPRGYFEHDHCPACHWSAHQSFGFDDAVPCGSPMRPTGGTWLDDNGVRLKMWRCTGCRYTYVNPVGYIGTLESYRRAGVASATLAWLDPFRHIRGAAVYRYDGDRWHKDTLRARYVTG